MSLKRLMLRSLLYYRRSNLAVIAGVATAVAVLSGALLVGQSVRESLRSLLDQRLGATEFIVSADRFFGEDLSGTLTKGTTSGIDGCPIIFLQGVVICERTGVTVHHVNIYGIDDRFWRFQGIAGQRAPEGRSALVGDRLAQRLDVREGEGLLLRIETQQGIPRESLFGRRENVGRTIRMVCAEILPAERLGEYALRPNQGDVYSIFVPLRRLQSDLALRARVNAIVLASRSRGDKLREIRDAIKEGFKLEDTGLKLRPVRTSNRIEVESVRIVLDETTSQAAFAAAADSGLKASGILTHLANSVRARGREIPYSVITAADLGKGALDSIHMIAGPSPASAQIDPDESIWLNEWASKDLGAAVGDPIEVDYYLWEETGHLVTQTARFRLAGVLAIGGDVDPSLAPDFPGVTDARSIRAWDPPFPLDLRKIRPIDEKYWESHRATPKAFISLARGQRLWQSRFGKLTAVRVALPETVDPQIARQKFAESLRSRLNPEEAGLAVTPVRELGLSASRGSTDFGEYFVYFSMFLIMAAILLSALFFRLGVEQRVREVGTLQAVGFPMQALRRLFLLEGVLLSTGGSLLGLFASVGYGWLMVYGLRTWWAGAVGTHRLYLHLSWTDLALGVTFGIFVSLATIAVTLRKLSQNSPRALLAGVLESVSVKKRRVRGLAILSFGALLAAILMLLGATLRKIPDVAGFFGAGFLLLTFLLSLAALYLWRIPSSRIHGHGWRALLRLGTRNSMHRPGRSLLCIALIASATFVTVSVEAFRREPDVTTLDRASGTGGYPLLADTDLPMVFDPNSAEGREALGIPKTEVPELARVKFVPFRARPGDDASCLNLYAPQEPRILGASRSFIHEARFSFQDSEASTPEQRSNPWLLLESDFQDGAIPALGDANTIQYILHLGLGRELTVRGSAGTTVRLRLVAELRDSILQGELLISEANFLRVFPDREGYQFFLLETPEADAASLIRPLEEHLSDWGLSVESSRERLASFHRVENTYLSTFQSLGALGLVLGTIGLATVLLRNVLERRQELALLRAVGYRRQVLAGLIVAENAGMMICGLACGTACALVSIFPALNTRGTPFPAAMVGFILIAVLIVGLTSSLLAAVAAFRSPLLEALRSE